VNALALLILAQAEGEKKSPAFSLDETLTNWGRMWKAATDFAEERGPGIVVALALIFLGWLLASWVRRTVVRACAKAHFDMTLGKFLGNLSRWAILAFVFVTCLGTVGISTTGFAAVIGAAGVAIALALQGNLSNLACGVLLLVFRPFKVGDAVIVAGQTGIIDGIDLFTTNLDTGDNRRIIVPNSAIFNGVIENQTRHPTRQAVVSVQVSARADLDATRATLVEAATRVLAVPGALPEPAPAANLTEINPVTWAVSVWTETPRFGAVRQALLHEVKLAVDGAGIAPLPQRMDVQVIQPAPTT